MKKQYYIEIDGKQVPVTEEVYRAYQRPLWAEKKRKERAIRCQISNGRGGLKRCEGDCSQCPHERNGSVLSLNSLEEDGFFRPDNNVVDPQKILEDALLLEMLRIAVAELASDNQMIIKLFSEGVSERKIAETVGLSQKGVSRRKAKIFSQLQARFQDLSLSPMTADGKWLHK